MRALTYIFTYLISATLLTSCQVDDVSPEDEAAALAIVNTENQELLMQGEFSGSSAHPSTSGKAKVFKNANGDRTLVIENLMVDNGPDLRIYMAEDVKVTNFVEITKDVKNGTISYAIPSSVDLNKQNVVSVWCKLFSVSFGSAPLKKPE